MASLRQFDRLTVPRPDLRVRPASGFMWRFGGLSDFVNAAASTETTVTATSGSAHTKGSWVEAVTSTSADIFALSVYLTADTGTPGTDTSTLLDIGVGAAGSEQVIVADVNVGYGAISLTQGSAWEFPVFVSAGSRIAFRVQSAVASKAVTVGARSKQSGGFLWKPARYCTSYGVVSASSRGTILTGAAVDTEPAWTQITAATAERLAGIVLCVGGGSDLALNGGFGLLDLAVGGAGSEVPIITNQILGFHPNEFVYHETGPKVHGVQVPAGSRLSARWMAGASGNTVDLVVVGIPWRP